MNKFKFKGNEQQYHRDWYHNEMRVLKTCAPFNGKCYICSEHNLDVLIFHHVYFNGAEHRELFNNSVRPYYRSMQDATIQKQYPTKLVCLNCHKLVHRGALNARRRRNK